MSFISRASLTLLLSCSAVSAYSQMVIQADSAAIQPQIGRDEVGFSSCGVRVVALVSDSTHIDAYDFSLMVRADILYGTLKAGKTRTPTSSALKGVYSKDAVLPPPVKFWVARETEGKAISPVKIFPSDTKGYILEFADLVDTQKGIMAMVRGERMQFAVRYKNQPVEVVVGFATEMPEKERAPLLNCMSDVFQRLVKLADD